MMDTVKWIDVSLDEILSQHEERISLDDAITYKQLTVALHGRGVRLRQMIRGVDVRTKTQYVARAGQFIYSRIDARNGAMGTVPTELDGAIVSGDFPVFNINNEIIDPRFFSLYIARPMFFELCERASRGVTNRRRLKEHQLLSLNISIPESVADQQRTVAQFDRVMGVINQIKATSSEAEQGVEALLRSAYHEMIADADWKPFNEVAELHRRRVIVEPDGSYKELGVRSFGKGTFHKPALTGTEIGSKRIFHIEPDDLVFNIVFAWEGAVAVVKSEDAGRVGSHRFLTYVPDPQQATAKFLAFHFLTYKGLEDLGKASPGAAGRNKTLGAKALENIQVPVPLVDRQRWFDRLIERRDEVMKIKREAALELAAVEPALLQRAFSFAVHPAA